MTLRYRLIHHGSGQVTERYGTRVIESDHEVLLMHENQVTKYIQSLRGKPGWVEVRRKTEVFDRNVDLSTGEVITPDQDHPANRRKDNPTA